MSAQPEHGRIVLGIAMAAAAFFAFSSQDALVKWLVAGHSVFFILFVRSLTVLTVSGLYGGRASVSSVIGSKVIHLQLLRGLMLLVAWCSYYTGARSLQLEELATLYFASPILVVVLAILFLGERVSLWRWLSVLVGFAGVVVTTNPTGRADFAPALLVLGAAALWAASNIVARQLQKTDPTLNQVIYGNLFFVLVCGPMLPWTYAGEGFADIWPMIGVGFIGAIGQFVLLEGFRRAPASVLAPIEYSGLLWAFLYGIFLFGDRPKPEAIAGASLILASAVIIVVSTRREARASAALEKPAGTA